MAKKTKKSDKIIKALNEQQITRQFKMIHDLAAAYLCDSGIKNADSLKLAERIGDLAATLRKEIGGAS